MPFNRNVKKRVTYLLGNGHPPLKITVTVSPQIILCLFGRNQTVFWKDKEKKIREIGSNVGPPVERDYY